MARKTRFEIAESNIREFFKKNLKRVYRTADLQTIFDEHRSNWNLPQSMNANVFIGYLEQYQILRTIEILFEDASEGKQLPGSKKRYLRESATIFEIALSLRHRSYLSHYSALFVSGLTTQIPKTIYMTFEQSPKNRTKGTLTQTGIDAAFAKPQREAGFRSVYEDYTFVILNGMHHNRIGVYSLEGTPVTNLERTLIDVTVRPSYGGGVFSVLEAYRRSLPKVSVNKLLAILDSLDFIYPYAQAVGFYLQRAGYEGSRIAELKKRVSSLDFYLAYAMEEKAFDAEWKLYYPKGM